MTPRAARRSHIEEGRRGRPRIRGSRFLVDQIAMEHVCYGWTAEEIYVQHARQLSMAQIHAALAYYYDHRDACDKRMARDDREFIKMRGGESGLGARLRGEGRLR